MAVTDRKPSMAIVGMYLLAGLMVPALFWSLTSAASGRTPMARGEIIPLMGIQLGSMTAVYFIARKKGRNTGGWVLCASVFTLLAVLMLAIIGREASAQPQFACARCGSVGSPELVTPGSVWIEIILFFCFLIPGIIYGIWRITSRRRTCAACGSSDVVPAGTPAGRKIKAQSDAAVLDRKTF